MKSLTSLTLLVSLGLWLSSELTFAHSPGLVRPGKWGGVDIGMQVAPSEAIIEFDCAHGRIDRPIPLDRQGDFDVAGIYVFEHGGPIVIGALPDSHPARYHGQVAGKKMFVTVTLTDTLEKVGSFILMHHQSGHVFKCLLPL